MKTIIINLDVVLAQRRMKLASKLGTTKANLSILKQGKVKAIRFSRLEAICDPLDYTPGEILSIEE